MEKQKVDSVKNKVKCKYCSLCDQEKEYCTVKKTKVSLNKKRDCEKHQFDENLVKPKKEIPSTRVPSWNLRSNLRKEEIRKLEELREQLIRQEQAAPSTQSSEYPLTGDLSRFRTTGTDENN